MTEYVTSFGAKLEWGLVLSLLFQYFVSDCGLATVTKYMHQSSLQFNR